jgi:hypothetical protein
MRLTNSSLDIPPAPAPVDLGCRLSNADMRDSDSLVLKVTLAFVCIPNTSGSSDKGSVSR